jgi:membrane protein implicated in regulation of membrane protease activity|tara:strand:+ start:280 stop:900 length:621 start_codon:yes stop_codon:yes gene_type:complete
MVARNHSNNLNESITMIAFFSDLNGVETFYAVCAGIGSFFVLVRMILQFFGGEIDDFDTDLDLDLEAGHTNADVGFKILSLHTISAFFMMFGLIGLALYRQSETGFVPSLIGGALAGFIAVWIIGKLFKIAGSLESSGTLATSKAVGRSGTVYTNISEDGTGRVTIPSMSRECAARTKDGKALKNGTPVRILEVHANVLIVEKIKF